VPFEEKTVFVVWFESFMSSVLQDIKDEEITINDKNVVVAILILFILN